MAAAAVVTAAFVVTGLRLGWMTPVATDSAGVFHDFGSAAPLFAWWQPHTGWGTPMAITVATVVIVAGPLVARSVSWRWLPPTTWAASVAWVVSLAMIDGWTRGITSKFTSRDEYLHEISPVGSLKPFLTEFTRHIVDGQAESWTTQTSGHPPGALLVFVALDRVGLGGPTWAAAVCIVVGASASAAIVVALGALSSPRTARRCAPFLVLTPAAVWIGVSGDGLFAGVAAWGLASRAPAPAPPPLVRACETGAGRGLGRNRRHSSAAEQTEAEPHTGSIGDGSTSWGSHVEPRLRAFSPLACR